jgi:hypothetical protein
LVTPIARSTTASLPCRRVTIDGELSSLAPSARIDTGPLTPPKLNHVRCQASAFIAAGSRQSARTTSSCAPAPMRTRASKGR